MLTLDDFRKIVPDEKLSEIYYRARRLYGKHIVHVNATHQGGGVAEILNSLVPLMNDLGIKTGWRVLHGSLDFFEVTKSFHNGLQGHKIELTEYNKQMYNQLNENFAVFTHIDHDCVIIHDPQPLPLIKSYKKHGPWVWRCHIDLSEPNEELWDYLLGFLIKYDQVVVSSEKYLKADLPIDQMIIPPAINPLTMKNKEIPADTIRNWVKKAGIPTDKPLLTQVSRLDPWKDPEGVLDVFNLVKERCDCRLVFCYNLAADDPEGLRIYRRVREKADKYVQKGEVVFVEGNNELLVNSVQRFSDVIIQKSVREGFCLAVTEAMWKGKPVVASQVGGIPLQIVEGENGYLADPKDIEGFAEKIVHLLRNAPEAEHLGKNARETVRKKFLTTRLLSDYLNMLNSVINK
ncbi:MAG: glycosyl transferase family 1 [Phycisphaerae bacterium SM23_30]|nr:MAG: glycosyl transferase family 1 [Phycisphaerae bacterium SM23_30]